MKIFSKRTLFWVATILLSLAVVIPIGASVYAPGDSLTSHLAIVQSGILAMIVFGALGTLALTYYNKLLNEGH
jgi:hypothetical protein